MSAAIHDPAVKWLRETAGELLKLAGNKRLVLASGRAPFTLAAQIFGMENFLKSLYKNRNFAHKLLEFTTGLSISYFKAMEDFVHGIFIADPVASGDVISKKHFIEFVFPYLKRVIREVKSVKKPTMLHICGDISDRLHLIPDTGADSLSLDAKVNIADAKSILGNKVCIAGNVDPVHILQFGSKNDVYNAAYQCMEQGAKNGGFILLPGCDLAADVPEENIKALVDSAHREIRQIDPMAIRNTTAVPGSYLPEFIPRLG
ncbi:MAG: uroporphyrinogen decarboxylase family protein [Eubacteriales bacterium]